MAGETASNSSSVKTHVPTNVFVTSTPERASTPSAFAPHEQTVISKRAPVPSNSGSRPSQIGKSLEGQQLGQFLLEEFVGGGGMGAVFRAVDKTLDRIVAVKVVSSEQTDEDTLRRFRNEAQSAARLDHPNIARVYSVGEEAGWNFIVFEFIEGVNVRDLVSHKGPLPLDEAISYVIQVADALEHASQRDVVHRDIKPSNLLVMQDGRAKLVDMGLARLHQVESSAEDITATGVTLGTFDYISPEQARDPRATDVRSDLYSLGCTFYYMLTGMPPFPEGTVLQKLLSHSSESPPDPRDLRADLPEELSAIAVKLMAKLPAHRYQRPSELTAELMKLCEKLGFVTPTARDLLLPGRSAASSRVAYHLPWLIPICLLFTIVFGIEAVLPQPTNVTQELIPSVLPEPGVDARDQDPLTQPPPAPIESDEPSSINAVEPSAGNIVPSSKAGTSLPDESRPSERVVAPSANEIGKSPARSEQEAVPLLESPEKKPVTAAAATSAVEAKSNSASETEAVGATDESSPNAAAPAASVSRSDAQFATDRLIVIPEGPPTPVPDPRVVPSLESALRRLADQPDIRVIELRCDRYETKPLTIDLRSDLTIEAGEGYSPLLVFDRREASQDDTRMMHLLSGRLTLRGIHFQVHLPYTSEEGWALFHLHQVQELTLERCTLTLQNDHRADAAFFHIQSPRLTDMPVPGNNVTTAPAPRPSLILKSCIARGEATFIRATEGLPFKLDFEQGLIATTERMIELGQRAEAVRQELAKVNLRHVTAEMESGLCRATMQDAAARLPQLHLSVENCLLDHDTNMPLIEHVGINDVAGTKSHAVTLSGQLNAFPRTNILWRLDPREGDSVDVLWDARFDSENTWYQDKISDAYAPWLDSRRQAQRVMHQVTPDDYLVADEEELGFDPTLLPELPSDAEPAAETE